MPDPNDRLIDAATRRLTGDAELKSSARRLLESLTEEGADQAEKAIARWGAIDRKNRRLSDRAIFYLTVVSVSVLLLAHAFMDIREYRMVLAAIRFDPVDHTKLIDVSRFNPREKLLLNLGDKTTTETQRAKALWDIDPQNAGYFSQYCSAYLSETTKLPPNFKEQVLLIDPKNAYFPYWTATLAAKDAAKARPLSRAARAAGEAPEWEVKDEAKLDQVLAILRECRDLPDYREYEVSLLREKIPILPQHTPSEYLQSVGFLSMTLHINLASRELAHAIAAKAWLYGERGDADGLIALKTDADRYLRNLSRSEPGLLIQEIIVEAWAKIVLKNLAASATKLGLTAEAADSQARLDRLDQLKKDREAAGPFQIEGEDASMKLGILNGNAITYTSRRALHPPTLTDAEVKPGRMIEHEFMAQLCTYGAWALLGLAAGVVALYRFRSPKVVRLLSARMEMLLKPVDWLCLLAAGIAPFAFLQAVTRAADLGGSEWNVMALNIDLPYYDGILLPMAQFAGALLMTVILTILTARWRLAKRVTFFGFSKTRYWSGWLALISAAVFIPLLGWSLVNRYDRGLTACWVLFALPIVWIVSVFIRAMTLGMDQLLHLTTVSRVLVPSFLATMAALLLFTPSFKWSRQQWFEQDRMNHLDANYPSLTKFEYQLSLAARKEVREALGYDAP